MHKRMILNMDVKGNIADYRHLLDEELKLQKAKAQERLEAERMAEACRLEREQLEKEMQQKNSIVTNIYKNRDSWKFKENLHVYVAVGTVLVAFFVFRSRK